MKRRSTLPDGWRWLSPPHGSEGAEQTKRAMPGAPHAANQTFPESCSNWGSSITTIISALRLYGLGGEKTTRQEGRSQRVRTFPSIRMDSKLYACGRIRPVWIQIKSGRLGHRRGKKTRSTCRRDHSKNQAAEYFTTRWEPKSPQALDPRC